MIDAKDVLRNLKFSPEDEVQVQRLEAEACAMFRSHKFDGRPVCLDVAVGKTDDEKERICRIVYALQRRFQACSWNVYVDSKSDAYGRQTHHRIWFAIDVAAARSDRKDAAAADTYPAVDAARRAAETASATAPRVIANCLSEVAFIERRLAETATDDEARKLADATVAFVDEVAQAMRRLKQATDLVGKNTP